MSDEAKPAGAGELDLNAIRGQLNLPEGAGEKEIIGALLQVIAAINAKYEQLLQDSVAVEQQVANRDLADFADVVPDEAKPFWTDQLLANRETTLLVGTIPFRLEDVAGVLRHDHAFAVDGYGGRGRLTCLPTRKAPAVVRRRRVGLKSSPTCRESCRRNHAAHSRERVGDPCGWFVGGGWQGRVG